MCEEPIIWVASKFDECLREKLLTVVLFIFSKLGEMHSVRGTSRWALFLELVISKTDMRCRSSKKF